VVESRKGYWIKVIADVSVRVKILIPPDNSGGYFSAQSLGHLKGLKSRGADDEEPPPPPEVPPAPDIKANGQDGPITVSPNTTSQNPAISSSTQWPAAAWSLMCA